MSAPVFDIDAIMRDVRAAANLREPATTATLLQNAPNRSNVAGVANGRAEEIEERTGHGGWSDDEDERAALVEEGAGVPRAWAEGFARLLPDHPPADVPPKGWKTIIYDVGRFLDGPFLDVAVKLGWGPYDLFGCDRDRPYARIDHMGLLWLLNGRKLIALTETTATIETPTGATHRYCQTADRSLPSAAKARTSVLPSCCWPRQKELR